MTILATVATWSVSAARGQGGPAYATSDFVLVGGSGGGFPSPASPHTHTFAGAGGGAVQLSSSGSLVIRASGVISAVRCGAPAPAPGSVGGGGSGGMIAVEAARIKLEPGATLSANGGGGSSGRTADIERLAAPGERGRRDATPAKGGGEGAWCSGGKGGALDGAATAGKESCDGGSATIRISAGGGGASGRIVFVSNVLGREGAVISPAAESLKLSN